ncbi:Hypothetical protein PBC10988_13020 [Planctomycetales bacterium 10988]|nr:Hypothetical protein PBC10988_13020 [Planctomycetales bacterium 10988]
MMIARRLPFSWRLFGFPLVIIVLLGVQPELLLFGQEPLNRIPNLIEQLGDPDYFIRSQAQEELSRFGADAIDALNVAIQPGQDLEVQKRARYLLNSIHADYLQGGESKEIREILEDYQQQDPESRRLRIEQLSQLPEEAGLVSLCRIVQFDHSSVLSKWAAVTIMEMPASEEEASGSRITRIQEALDQSLRPGARWLRLSLQAEEGNQKAFNQFLDAVQAERRLFSLSPVETSRPIVLSLLSTQVRLQRAQGLDLAARATMMEMIELEIEEDTTLTRLIDESIEQADWASLDQVVDRFEQRIDQSPILLYRLAEVQQLQGNLQKAKDLADRALQLNPEDPRSHFLMAYELGKRGLWKWSQQEAELLQKQPSLVLPYDLSLPEDPIEPVGNYLRDFLEQEETNQIQRVEKLASLHPSQGLSALSRIVRFTPEEKISKLAALGIIEQAQVDPVSWPWRAELLSQTIGREDRTGIQWVQVYLLAQEEPAQAAEKWLTCIQDEIKFMAENRNNVASQQFINVLRQNRYHLLRELDETAMAKEELLLMVEEVPAMAPSLVALKELMIKKQEWEMLDLLGQKNDRIFKSVPMLLYAWAAAKKHLGNEDAAKQFAKQALGFKMGERAEHWSRAVELKEDGMTDWAEVEFRETIDRDERGGIYAINAMFRLAEIWHEQERHMEAADLLQEAIEDQRANAQRRDIFSANFFPTRIEYFKGLHHLKQGDLDQANEHLEKAVKLCEEEPDADVLIAFYRLPNLTAQQSKWIKALIQKTAASFEKEIALREREDNGMLKSTPYNQYAWLISNTEGDYEQALKYSRKSLELRPGMSGYLDTLGRAYFAIGDLDQAIAIQKEAVKRDPYSPPLVNQLEYFQKEKQNSKESKS